ncbi:MAG: hypothetical protein IPM39_20650 [Chloroflexi bacterium]|nr:hypothetical protein [Chloroflexota bacterium]
MMSRRKRSKTARKQPEPQQPINVGRHGEQSSVIAPELAEQLPEHATTRPLRQSAILQLQQTHGNGFVQRYLPPAMSDQAIEAYDAMEEKARGIGDAIHEALYSGKAVGPSLTVMKLMDHNLGMRAKIQSEFAYHHGQSLQSFLKSHLTGDMLVKAFALLEAEHFYDYHVDVALALIPEGTRDAHLIRILQSLPLAGRKKMETIYNQVFRQIGEGSLLADLQGDLATDKDLYQALALMHREKLNKADELYMMSTGQAGTETDAVVELFMSAWEQGPEQVVALEKDWNAYVRNHDGWSSARWDNMGLSLYEAMDGELSGRPWHTVKAILDGTKAYQESLFTDKALAWGQQSLAEIAASDADPGAALVNIVLRDAFKVALGKPVLEETAENSPQIASKNLLNAAMSGDLVGMGQATEQLNQQAQQALERLYRTEEIQLQTAWDIVTATTDKGGFLYTGAGTDDANLNRAIGQMQTIWQGRIERAAGTPQEAVYKEQWAAVQTRLRLVIKDEMSEGSVEYERAHLRLAGDLRPADEIYLALRENDNAKLLKLATKFWATGELADVHREMRRERPLGAYTRPPFDEVDISRQIGALSPLDWERAEYMLLPYPPREQAMRGALRLELELRIGDGDGDLKRAYDFLNDKNVSESLRRDIIAQFVARQAANQPGDNDTQKFLAYIDRRYDSSYTCYEFRDLLDPTTDLGELVARGEGRLAASESGLMDPLLNVVIDNWDAMTGEDDRMVTLRALERLRFIQAQAGAKDEELAAMLAMTGKTTPQELGQFTYDEFKANLEQVRAVKNGIAEGMATAVSLAVQAVLAAATAGAASGPLVVALGGAVAEMLAKEALLGKDFELTSAENAGKLMQAVGEAGMGMAISKVNILDAETLKKMGRAGSFVDDAAKSGIEMVSKTGIEAAYKEKLPDDSQVFEAALAVLVAGGKGAMTHRIKIEEVTDDIGKLKINVAANIAANVSGDLGKEGYKAAQSGDWEAVHAKVLEIVVIGTLKGAHSAASDFASGKVEDKRKAQTQKEIEALDAQEQAERRMAEAKWQQVWQQKNSAKQWKEIEAEWERIIQEAETSDKWAEIDAGWDEILKEEMAKRP